MNSSNMESPASGVPPQLVSYECRPTSIPELTVSQLPHVHLVSTHRYPHYGVLQLNVIVELLMQAPHVMRDVAPVNWQFLDAPPDGSIMLIWQPPPLGTMSASDGLVYASQEQAFSSEVQGYVRTPKPCIHDRH